MINLQSLDKLVTEHLDYVKQVTELQLSPVFADPPTNPQVTAASLRVRRHVLDGQLDDALAVCATICSHQLQDPHLQLKLRRHKLLELINTAASYRRAPVDGEQCATQGYDVAINKALEYSRELAEFALNAFPEAYAAFMDAMLLFIQVDDYINPEEIVPHRKALADNLGVVILGTLGARASQLDFTLRYLLLIDSHFHSRALQHISAVEVKDSSSTLHTLISIQGKGQTGGVSTSSSQPPVISQDVPWERTMAPPTPSDFPPHFPEEDVQALRERVHVARQEAVDALRTTRGDVVKALRNELLRVVLPERAISQLAVDYAAARGLPLPKQLDCSPSPRSHNLQSIMQRLRNLHESADLTDKENESVQHDLDSVIKELRTTTSVTPALHFRVAQRKVLRLAARREVAEALRTAQLSLTPLLDEDDGTMREWLTDTLLILTFGQEGSTSSRTGGDSYPSGESSTVLREARTRVIKNSSLSEITRTAYRQLEEAYGDPELAGLFRVLLSAHKEWEESNMIPDKYAAHFRVDGLRAPDGTPDESESTEDSRETNEQDMEESSGAGGVESSSTPASGEQGRREQIVLVLMEFLGMTRADALAVIRIHPQTTTAEAILDSLLGPTT